MSTLRLSALGVLFASTLSLPALASGGYGMTWAKSGHGASPGVDLVSCANCDPYTGDTACSTALPVLCINKDGSPAPAGLATNFYYGWAQGNIATTLPTPGTALTSLAAADNICTVFFGSGWRMAEFHDGNGGWNWYAYGNVRADTRFWVHVNDQPANCWN